MLLIRRDGHGSHLDGVDAGTQLWYTGSRCGFRKSLILMISVAKWDNPSLSATVLFSDVGI